jgi:hypothetical protein
MNKLEKLIASFENSTGFIYTVVKLPNQDTPELIINSAKSAYLKIQHFKNAYNPDLTLKANNEVRIVGWGWSVDVDSIAEYYITDYLEGEQ